MLKFSLKSSLVSQHKSIAKAVNIEHTSKYERNRHRYEECLFLTQDGNRLTYTTCTERCVIQSWHDVDFKLPHPITVNLATVPYNLSGDNVCVEIPSCTLETLKTFYNDARPKYIKNDDLKTNVIAINGKRANMEYIRPEKFLDRLENIVREVRFNPFCNHTQYQWFARNADKKIDTSDISKVYKVVCNKDVFEYEYLRYPGDTTILRRIDELHAAADRYGILTHVMDNGVDNIIHHMPVAIFNKTRQNIIWMGIPRRIK